MHARKAIFRNDRSSSRDPTLLQYVLLEARELYLSTKMMKHRVLEVFTEDVRNEIVSIDADVTKQPSSLFYGSFLPLSLLLSFPLKYLPMLG